ncbi:ABC transporter ATP-binding protein [soil metagenome]
MKNSDPGDAAIRTDHLTKRYRDTTALSEATISVPIGTIYGFLGPNGAGKTTLIRLLMGFIKPTSGTASIFGFDSWRDGLNARRDLGFLVPADGLYTDMSGEAQLDYAARLSNRQPVLRDVLLDALELQRSVLSNRLGSYSKGMKQKLALIAAMQHDPALLILDEPTDGLDPLIQRNFEEFLVSLQNRGRTIFMSSHDLPEVERICELVAVVRSGVIVAEERIANLQQRHGQRATITFKSPLPDLSVVPGITVRTIEGKRVELLLSSDPNPLLHFLAMHEVENLTISSPSLEDIFMAYYEPAAGHSVVEMRS